MIKLLKREKSFTKKRESLWLDMSFYWEVAVVFTLIIAVLSVLFGYYFFIQINKEIILEESDALPQIKTVKKGRIENVLQYFSDRKEKSNQILNSPASVVDPSL